MSAIALLIAPLDLGPVKKTYLRRQVGGVTPDCSQRGQRQQHKSTFDYLLRGVLRRIHSPKKITTWSFLFPHRGGSIEIIVALPTM